MQPRRCPWRKEEGGWARLEVGDDSSGLAVDETKGGARLAVRKREMGALVGCTMRADAEWVSPLAIGPWPKYRRRGRTVLVGLPAGLAELGQGSYGCRSKKPGQGKQAAQEEIGGVGSA